MSIYLLFYFLQNTSKALKKKVRKEKVGKRLSLVEEFPVTFTQRSEDREPHVELEIAPEGEIRDGWKITPHGEPMVCNFLFILCSVHIFYYYAIIIYRSLADGWIDIRMNSILEFHTV